MKKFFDIKLLKFIGIGIVNTLVGTLLSFLFLNTFRWNYWFATSLSYILTSIMSYLLNKYFTFKNQEKGIKPILRFALNILVCYTLAYGIAQPAVSLFLNIPFISNKVSSFINIPFMIKLFENDPGKFKDNIAVIVGMCLFTLFNYIGQRFFAFKEKHDTPQVPHTKDH